MTSSPSSSSSDDDRYQVIHAGFTGDSSTARAGLTHIDAAVRESALRALARLQQLTDNELANALRDPDNNVRRAAVELSVSHHEVDIVEMINDSDLFVAEMTAWALGERSNPQDHEVNALIDAVFHHNEALVREAATAALGSIGDERGLPAILHACNDKPAVRRRAVLALAPFEGEEVTAALETALQDRDWQVRQNAEDMLNPRGYA